jgi:DNA-binding MarR family transcriptional regulator
MPWLEQVATLNPIDFKVAVCIWWQGGYNKFSGFICSGVRRRRLGINRWSFHRSLKRLEANGLVAVERKPHACPIISIPEHWLL